VTLLDMDDLKAFAERGKAQRRNEVAKVDSIVCEEVERWIASSNQREVAPLIAELREHAEELRESELARYSARLAGLDARDAEAVQALTRSLLAKVLHEPTVQLKEAAGSARGEQLAEALRALFGL
jgi:glutamyl-tRNA reductase